MTIEERTIEFLEYQISNNYKELCAKYLINSVEWLENPLDNELRPYARLNKRNKESNLILLFPPFNTKK
tara:strand:- start:381 stop:587 length:207 start_codon:yes stop_codon:yes gene_type:complete